MVKTNRCNKIQPNLHAQQVHLPPKFLFMTNSFEKSPVRFRLFVSMVYVVATPMLAMLCASTGQAETILIKANTATMNLAADWTPNGVPTNANIGKFDGAISSGNEGSLALGGNVTLAGLVFSNNLNGPVSIAASVNTLTLDSSMIAGGTGIDMSIANQNVTNNSPLTLKGFQAWNVISGKALTLGGALTHTGAGVDFSSFAGKLGTLANVNGILGPWATIGSGTSLKYATNNAGVAIGSYTGGTALPTTGGSATANYTLSTAQTETAAITGNTLQYTGNAQTLALGAAGTSTLTLNGLMNSGTGALTIGADGNTNIVIGGANNELVIAGNTNGITIFSAITNNPAGASSVTYNGLGTLTLGAGTTSGVNSTTENSSSFTGDFVINSGIVSVKKEVSLNSLGAGQNLTTSALGSPAVARNVIINNGAILSIDISNPFGPGATSKSNPGYPQFTIVVNNGGMFRTTTGNATIGPLVLNGGTVSITSPNKATFAPLGLENDVTVGGSSPSFSTASAGGGFNLTVTNTQVRIFNVADATGDANVDLTVSAVMDDNTSPAGASSFIKAGVGTMLLAATNIYSGVTTISAGTLIAGTNSPSGAVGAFGNASSAIVLGDANTTANNSSPALLAGGAFTIGRAITVAAQPSTGTYTIGGYTDNNSTFSGLITINTNLTVSQAANAGANTLTISGGITGGNAGSKTITFAGPGNALIASTAISDGGGTVAVNVTGGKNTFAVPNTYSGSTTIISNVLALTGSGSISNSGSIGINAGGTFDVSGLAGTTFNLSGSTWLGAGGTASAATIKGASGGTVNLGSQPIVLTYDGSHPALTVSQGTLSLNGNAFTVNSSSSLAAGNYTIVQQTSGAITSAGSYTVSGTAIPGGAVGTISVSGGNVILIITVPTITLGSLTAINYGGTATLTATVSPAPDGGTVQFLDNGVAVGSPVLVNTGTGVASLNVNTFNAGNHPVSAFFSGTTNFGASTSGTSTQSVSKATPVLSAPVATAISYGQTLAGSGLSGGAATNANNNVSVSGSFAFTTPGIAPLAGSTNVSVTFTPTDTADYNAATATVSVSVSKATPVLSAPVATAISYGQTLAGSGLSGGAATNANNNVSVSGSFAFTGPGIAPLAGSTNVSVTFTPTDTADYNAATATVSVSVNQLPVQLTGTRAYDGTTTVTAAILSVTNAVGGDNVTVASGSGSVASPNAGWEPITSFGTLALGGSSSGNYTLTGAGGSVGIVASALTWNPGRSNSGPTDGGGTWLTTNGWWNGLANVNGNWTGVAPNGAIFGAGTNGAYLVNLGGSAVSASNVVFNTSGYTLTNGTLAVTSTAGVTVNASVSAAINAAVTTLSAVTVNSGGVLSLGGGSSAFLSTTVSTGLGTLQLTATTPQTFSSGGGGNSPINMGTPSTGVGGLVIGNNSTLNNTAGTFEPGFGGNGLVTINGGTLNFTTGNLVAGRSASGNGRVILVNGAITMGANIPIIAFQGAASGELDVQGGLFSSPGANVIVNTTTSTSGLLSISGGLALCKDIDFGGGFSTASSSGTGRLVVSGGSLYVGSGGILQDGTGTFSSSTSLSGGTVGALTNWSSSLPMTLTNDTGNITFKAADTNGNPFNITLSGALAGLGGLNKSGGGTLTLSGTNSYAGNTTVNAGTLATTTATSGGGAYSLAAGTALGVNLASAGTSLNIPSLTLNAGSTLNLDANSFGNPTAPIINVSGALTPASTVTINFTGIGLTSAQFPLIKYGSLGGAGFGAFILGSSLTPMELVNNTANNSIDVRAAALVWDGTVNGSWDIGNTANWKGGVVYTESSGSGPSVLFSDAASGSTNIVLNVMVSPAAVVVSNSILAYGISGSGGIAGAGSLTKIGDGTLILGGANTYTGGTTVNGGTLALTTTNNVSMPYTNTGGTLKISLAASGTSLP